MSEFLKETDKLLGKAVKSINDNLFTDTDKDANVEEEETESPVSQKNVERATQKKTAPSTNEQLKSIEEHKEPSVWEELKEGCKESCREFILFQLCTTEGGGIALCDCIYSSLDICLIWVGCCGCYSWSCNWGCNLGC